MRGIYDRGVVKTGRSKLGRWVALGVAAVIAVAAAAYACVERRYTANVQRGAFEGAVTVYPYNFTRYDVAYSTTTGLRMIVDANAAAGTEAQTFGYKPESPDAPLNVLWRYASGPDATPEGVYPFQVTLPQPRRPSGQVVLELRIYPSGKVAARYAAKPLVSDVGNLAPELPGKDWVTNQ